MMTPAKHRRSTGQQHYHLRLGLVVLGLAPNPAAPQSVRSPGEAIAQWSTNYDKYLRPNLFMGQTDPDEIRMGFYTVRVWDVLPVAESFSVEAYLFCLATVSKFDVRYFPFDTHRLQLKLTAWNRYLRLSWKDPRLAYNITAGFEGNFDSGAWLNTWCGLCSVSAGDGNNDSDNDGRCNTGGTMHPVAWRASPSISWRTRISSSRSGTP